MASSEFFYKRLLDGLHDGIYFADPNRTITYWNHGAERITGYSAQEIIGSSCADSVLGHVTGNGIALCHGMCPLAATLLDGKDREADVYLHHKDGHRVPVTVRVAPIWEDGAIVGAVETFTETTSRLAALERIEQLENLALVCPLTHVANRRLSQEMVQDRLEELKRYHWPFGLLFFDIDHFKRVNDEHGHETGDEALKMVARTLTSCLRSFDIVGRWGGEEFIALTPNVTRDSLTLIAQRCRSLVERSHVEKDGMSLGVTVSVGGTLGQANDTPDTLIKRADDLMYRSKKAGRNRAMVA